MNFRDYKLGCLDTIEDPLMYTGATVGIIPDADYPKPFSRAVKMPIRDQGPDGKCFAYAGIKVMEIQNYFETGEMVRLSEDFYYWQKVVRSSPGMIPMFDIAHLRKVGTCLKADFECVGEWDVIDQYIKDYQIDTDMLKKKAAKFRAKTTLKLSREELSPYLHMWKAGIISVNVYDSFYDTGADGLVPWPSGNNNGGHAMEVDEIIQEGPKFYVCGDNSWTDEWGNKGRFKIDMDNPCIKGYYGIVDSNPVTAWIDMEIGDIVAKTSLGDLPMDAPPMIWIDPETGQGYTMVHTRLISEFFGKACIWIPPVGKPGDVNYKPARVRFEMTENVRKLLEV